MNWQNILNIVFQLLAKFGIKTAASKKIEDEKKNIDEKLKESDTTGRPS